MAFVQFNFSYPARTSGRPLSRFSIAILLLYGLTLLLIHLGDTRVLTRHEVLAAQPGREMLHDGDWRHWMLPTLAGVSREAKPPGMMWLIAASIYIFRSEAEWVARLPSALAGLAVALMIAKLTARWFGNRVGRLAGLLQFTFVYTLQQAKLTEADMTLTAAVCAAMCALAIGTIDSPFGVDTRRCNRLIFWLAAGASFLLKGPIGLIFIGLGTAAFFYVSRDRRMLKLLADPVGMICFVIMVTAWPILAWRLDPSIVHVWKSEMVGTATGRFESEPIYYYIWSVPGMVLPWTPLALIGLWRGPNAELMGSIVEQTHRKTFWRFLFCWFIPGFLFLTLAMKMKHHHYSMPILPPLAVPTALGLDYFIRRQTSRRQGLAWPFFLAGCAIAALIVWKTPLLLAAMKPPMIKLIGVIALGGLAALHFERAKRPAAMIASYLMTAWAVGVGIQAWVMPVQDDYKFQADFARVVNGTVPPGATVHLMGHREEEQEAEYAYYLRYPMQRLTQVRDLPKPDAPVYAIAPAGFLPELSGFGRIQTIAKCQGLRVKETESDRLLLLRITAQSRF
jgi:4-amino-4-deoxy-L-arabinose transferase-like glycosyltransferase